MDSPRFDALICEPDAMTQAGLRGALEAAGYDVVATAVNGVEALRHLQFTKVGLVLSGYELPGMTGLELAEDIRKDPSGPEVVLLLSDLALRDRALDVGCYAIAPRGDRDALDRVLAEVHHFLVTGERRKGGERRTGGDRRVAQDWSKVTSERRSGTDRRRSERRADETPPT